MLNLIFRLLFCECANCWSPRFTMVKCLCLKTVAIGQISWTVFMTIMGISDAYLQF